VAAGEMLAGLEAILHHLGGSQLEAKEWRDS